MIVGRSPRAFFHYSHYGYRLPMEHHRSNTMGGTIINVIVCFNMAEPQNGREVVIRNLVKGCALMSKAGHDQILRSISFYILHRLINIDPTRHRHYFSLPLSSIPTTQCFLVVCGLRSWLVFQFSIINAWWRRCGVSVLRTVNVGHGRCFNKDPSKARSNCLSSSARSE